MRRKTIDFEKLSFIMRRFLIFSTLIMLSAFAMAQNTKKVAILETVDKEGNVPYGIRLQLRSNLTYVISSTAGYEGYDRVDMSSIMGEHNFQRTGMVSDAQIKKLGEMTGATSILVAEAAIYDQTHIIITAKILNVETASVENSAPPQIAGTDPEAMQNACTQLAAKLLGSSSNSGNYTTQRPGSVSQGAATLTFTAGGVSFEMIKVEAGSFIMGCTSEQGGDCGYDESPYHRVTISQDYYIGKFEVTQELYEAVMGTNPSTWKGFDHPVENINWNDAMEFCAELSRLTGRRFTLPSEAEWEYAARGGQKTTNSKHCGGSRIFDLAWYKDNSGGHTHPVGQLNANELGIYDMNGNVWEWVYDAYGSYSSNPQTDPIRDSGSNCRVLRGGGWHSSISNCRTASRSYASYYRHSCKEPDSWSKDHGYSSWDDHDGDWGFRVVLH